MPGVNNYLIIMIIIIIIIVVITTIIIIIVIIIVYYSCKVLHLRNLLGPWPRLYFRSVVLMHSCTIIIS